MVEHTQALDASYRHVETTADPPPPFLARYVFFIYELKFHILQRWVSKLESVSLIVTGRKRVK